MNKIHGFKKIASKYIAEVDCEAAIYEHERLGAKLLHLPNEDDNKVFNIQFVTLPEDDTGIAHILEHSVLAGSEKYPLKEPFVNLLKSSLNTFLNAMTAADKTMYPFASQNEQDFLNMLDVYLDAVFAPRIKTDPLILRQEGWRYEQFSAAEQPRYNGIVFNEMKGAMSAPDSRLDQICRKAVFDNSYQFNSGGQPSAIVELTDQDFIDFYEKNYHPSNSFIFLYGDIAPEPVFQALDEKFAKYRRSENLPILKHTSVIEQPQYCTGVYPAQDDDLHYAQIQIVFPKVDPAQFLLFANAMQIISLSLFSMESSGLRQSILTSGLAQEVYSYSDFSKYDPNLQILLIGIPDFSPQEIEQAFRNELNKALDNYEADVFAAALNSYSFNLREADSQSLPQGLIRGIVALRVWPYGIDPFESLAFESRLDFLANKIDSDYFKVLIKENIIDNQHRVTAVLTPSPTEAAESLQREQEKLNRNYNSLNQSQKQALIQMNHDLLVKQNTPDSPEALASLPRLKRSDLKEQPNYQMLESSKLKLFNTVESIPLLTYFGSSKGIVYLSLQFDLAKISQAELFELSLLTEIWGNIDTENYSYQDLTNYSLTHTGGISINLTYSEKRRYLEVRIKFLESKVEQGLHLLEEILLRTKFSDQNRIHQLLSSLFSGMQLSLADDGITLGRKRLKSYFDPSGKFDDLTSGIAYYQNLKNLMENWQHKADALLEKFSSLVKRLIIREQITLFFAGEQSGFDRIKNRLNSSLLQYPAWTKSGLTEQNAPDQEWDFNMEIANEAFIIPSDVQFVIGGNNLRSIDPDWKFNGSLHVLRQIINTDYLWNTIRVKGGAYGASILFDRQGNLILASYRDPECGKTYQVYAELENYLTNLTLSNDELTGYLIGTIANLDQPLSFPAASRRAKSLYDQDITAEQLQTERQQILNIQVADLKQHAQLIGKALAEDIRCTLGNSEKLNQEKDLFKSTEILN
ncbi:MAG: insulinase family protein [Saccharofermentanales bacterium]|jgi:Zn-dependent M16 (insulinase) family peptidase